MPKHVKKLLDKWYRERAKIKFPEYAEPLVQRFRRYDVEPKDLYIQKMETRWGSCSAKGNIINPELIKSPNPALNTSSSTNSVISSTEITPKPSLDCYPKKCQIGRSGKRSWRGRWRENFDSLKRFKILKEVLYYSFKNKRI